MLKKLMLFLLIATGSMLFAAGTLPEKVKSGVTPAAFKAQQAQTHQYVMAEQLPIDHTAMVEFFPNPADLDELHAEKAERGKMVKRLKIGAVQTLGAGVDFSGLKLANLRSKVSAHAGGVMRQTAAGGLVWTMGITSPDATALRLRFIDVNLPKGVGMYVYNADGEAFGPFTFRGPNDNGDFWANTVTGPVTFIQIRHDGPISAETLSSIKFVIEDATYIGSNFLVPFFNGSAKPLPGKICSFNANCVEDGSCYGTGDWGAINDARNATAHIQFVSGRSAYICSGGLLNDTDSSSQIPYFLTANHCISTSSEASSMEAFWQFATSSCGGSCYNPDGAVPSTLGATILATSQNSDYTLMQLSQTPPSGSVLLGWTDQPVANTNNEPLYRISHPGGAPQAYSQHDVDTGAGTCSSWPRGAWIYSNDITGATEGGSSGSVVCNAAGQVVGQLSGACGFNVNDSCDSASNSTVDGALAAYYSNVAEWLDPSDTVDPPPAGYTLSANGYKVRGRHTIDLSWSGATGSTVDIYRNGSVIATVSNSGSYTDATGNRGGGRSYTYQVCDGGTSTCSNSVTVNF